MKSINISQTSIKEIKENALSFLNDKESGTG